MGLQQMAYFGLVISLIVIFLLITIYAITTGSFVIESKIDEKTAANLLSYIILTDGDIFAYKKVTFEKYYNYRTYYGILDKRRIKSETCSPSNLSNCSLRIFFEFSPDNVSYSIRFYNLEKIAEGFKAGVPNYAPVATITWIPCEKTEMNYTLGFPVTVTDGINYEVWAVVIETWECEQS